MKKVVSLLLAMILIISTLASCNWNQNPPNDGEHTHVPGAWVTVKEPSCKEGEQCQFCVSCGDVIQTAPIAATGIHNEVVDEAVDATCTNTGLTEGKHCIACGKIVVAQVETPKLAHSYDNDKDGTCNTCDFVRDTNCKHTDVTVLPAKDATCTEAGITEGVICNGCEEVLQEQQIINALGHNEVIDKGYDATCTTAGLTDGKHCETCGETLVEQSYIKAKGHDESEWIIEKEPTEIEDGYKYKECYTCGEKTEEEIIPFVGNTGLEYSVNADGKTCTITGIGSFEGTKLNVPEYIRNYKVTGIGAGAFSDCIQLTEINLPETITTIGTRAFYGCTGLTAMTIPKSVTKIGTEIFAKADNLSTVYYNGTYGDVNNAFLNTDSIKKVVFGGLKVPQNVLKHCSNIIEIEIKESVTSIGNYAFSYCQSLEVVTIPDSVTSIGIEAFYECDSLTSITLGKSVTSIGMAAFNYCGSLVSVTLSNSVTTIGKYAFNDCSSLKNINFAGTVEQWNFISKYTYWDRNTGDYIIYCNDGEIAKDGTVTSK